MFKKENISTYIFYILLITGVLISLLPFVWMITSSFKSLAEISEYPPTLLPNKVMWNNYVDVFDTVPYGRNLFNSFFVAIMYTVVGVFISATGGYALSKYREAPGRRLFFAVILSTMMIPMQVLAIPLYIMMAQIGWINSYPALILPFAAQGFGLFMLKQYIDGIPDDLIEAARIDGCGEFRIFFQIIFPVIKPAVAALGTIYFMNNYNLFFWPLIVTNRSIMYTVPVAIAQLQGQQFGIPLHHIMAAATLSTAPLIIIFLYFQKYIISGITMGALKG